MQSTLVVAENIEGDQPATSMGWTPTGLRICQGSSAQPVGTPWSPIPPESYSLCQRRKNTAQNWALGQFAGDNIFLAENKRCRCMCRMVLLMCTFDLNVLQGLPENPRHDVCEPHHLHDDLQRQREQWGQFFSTCRIQRALHFSSDYFRTLHCGEITASSFWFPSSILY